MEVLDPEQDVEPSQKERSIVYSQNGATRVPKETSHREFTVTEVAMIDLLEQLEDVNFPLWVLSGLYEADTNPLTGLDADPTRLTASSLRQPLLMLGAKVAGPVQKVAPLHAWQFWDNWLHQEAFGSPPFTGHCPVHEQ